MPLVNLYFLKQFLWMDKDHFPGGGIGCDPEHKSSSHPRVVFYRSLKAVDKSLLLQYELVGRGTGVHWPLIDEDLSLKGFLQNELRKVVKNDK